MEKGSLSSHHFFRGNKLKDLSILLEFQKQNIVWKLKTCIYGLSHAIRKWYLRMKDELCKLGFQCIKFEPSLFYYRNSNHLDGIIITHVYDFCWGGRKI